VIPRAYVTAWRAQAPWPTDAQVEQDLVLSRALTELYGRPRLAPALAFRGGTALHKLFFDTPGRYSEDIDLVQIEAGPIGPVLLEVRAALDPWLGDPTWKQSADSVKLLYRFESTGLPVQPMRLKIEINTREHFAVRGLRRREFAVETLWHSAKADITTYDPEELLGAKLRALYQRKKGRDLYDLWLALTTLDLDAYAIVVCFRGYMERDNAAVSRAMFEANLVEKMQSKGFGDDVRPLLRDGETYDVDSAGAAVQERLLALLPGDPWRGASSGRRRAGRHSARQEQA
jgi:predicted nucleotidyltransferase component of viral defense system